MKKKDVPQDQGPLKNFTREVQYAKNDDGKFEKALSEGWDVKNEALDAAWDDLNKRIEEAKQLVLKGEKSPVYYFMEKNLMDMKVLSCYTGFGRFAIKKHMKPSAFSKLSDDKLERYADAFDISVNDLKNFNP